MYRFNSANMRQFYSNELYAIMIPSIVEILLIKLIKLLKLNITSIKKFIVPRNAEKISDNCNISR